MREVTQRLYEYGELSEGAKAKARDWFRGLEASDVDLSAVIEDAERICAIVGIELRRHTVPLMGGSTREEPNIWYSGFGSQGDGACFEGVYQYRKGSARQIRAYAPQDATLQAIADDLAALQRAHGYRITATLQKTDHHYCHPYTVSVDAWIADEAAPSALETELAEILRRLMQWIYEALEAEYEYRLSDEAIAETIEANEYEFTEDGKRADL